MAKKIGRDAGSGKFIPKTVAKARKSTALVEKLPSRKPSKADAVIRVGRDAKTGQFITVKKAERRKKTAVVETIVRPTKTGDTGSRRTGRKK